MIDGPEIEFERYSYNCRLRVASWAREPYLTGYDTQREFVADRRIPDMYRFSVHDFDPNRYTQLALLNQSRDSSVVVPANHAVYSRYIELDAHVAQLIGRIVVVSGTSFLPAKKVLFSEETSGAAIPHRIWRAVLCHFDVGRIKAWAFSIPNIASPPSLESCACSLRSIECETGVRLFTHLADAAFDKTKHKTSSRWW